MLTGEQLSRIMPNLPRIRRDYFLPFLVKAMDEYAINSPLRQAAFLAQLAHESCEFRYMEEIASGQAYEGRADLGNTHPGDGRRYKGRGPIQLTGRANYERYGRQLGVDLVNHPDLAATPEVGFRIAGLYWKAHGLNDLSDAEDFTEITQRINGGQRGAGHRRTYYERARGVLCAAPPERPLHVMVNGEEVLRAHPYLAGGRLMVALRPVADAAGWCIVEASCGRAILRDQRNADHEVPLVIRGRTGYVALRDLPGEVTWDDGILTGKLNT